MPKADIRSKAGLLLATGYTRVVIGGRGPYVEFFQRHLVLDNFHIPKDQEYRIDDRRAYYVEYRSNCAANVKLYVQKRTVAYADYQIGYCYISPFLFMLNGEACVTGTDARIENPFPFETT